MPQQSKFAALRDRASRSRLGDERAAATTGLPGRRERAARASPPREPSAVWRWITGGNALTRVGIVILFFGVAFLLRYFAEIVTVPIEIKLAGAGAGGLLLAESASCSRAGGPRTAFRCKAPAWASSI